MSRWGGRRNRDAHRRTNCGHTIYHLTCEEFGQIEHAAAGRCGICLETETPLYVDHAHAVGARAVRGMVCPSCNILLAAIDCGRRPPPPAIAAYLADPWYERVGLDGRCPPACANSEHARWLKLALKATACR